MVIHCIDGPGLCNPSEQEELSLIAACPNVHIVASAEHVDFPILWSQRARTRFAWLPVQAHTHGPYLLETRTYRGDAKGGGIVFTMEGLRSVFNMCAVQSVEVFLHLATMAQDTQQQGDWPTVEDFKDECIARMLALSSEGAMTHLVEFRDHGWVRVR